MLEVRDLECRYGTVAALKGVSLSVDKGQIVALIGANGAGKSTMLRSLSGLLPPARGSIVFEGQEIARCSPPQILRRGIAHCPEGRHVFPDMSVEENLDMGAYLRRSSFLALPSGGNRLPARCQAANSRCWRSDAR